MERPKMELEVNKPTRIKLLFNDCVEGSSKFGKYYLYAIQNGDGRSEYSLFAADELHNQLKQFKKDDELIVTKLGASRNGKIVITWEVKKIEGENVISPLNNPNNPQDDIYYSAMEKSFEDAIRIQNKYNGLANVNQLAVTIYISRLRQTPSYNGG